MRLFCVCVAMCVGSGLLRRAHHSPKESYRLWKMITELKKRPGPWMGWESHWEKNKLRNSSNSILRPELLKVKNIMGLLWDVGRRGEGGDWLPRVWASRLQGWSPTGDCFKKRGRGSFLPVGASERNFVKTPNTHWFYYFARHNKDLIYSLHAFCLFRRNGRILKWRRPLYCNSLTEQK
jgi:hypothetical protein